MVDSIKSSQRVPSWQLPPQDRLLASNMFHVILNSTSFHYFAQFKRLNHKYLIPAVLKHRTKITMLCMSFTPTGQHYRLKLPKSLMTVDVDIHIHQVEGHRKIHATVTDNIPASLFCAIVTSDNALVPVWTSHQSEDTTIIWSWFI